MEVKNNKLHLYSLAQAAKLLGIGRDTLHTLVAQGKIGVITISKRNKISHAELQRFINDNTSFEQSIPLQDSVIDLSLPKPELKGKVNTVKIFDDICKEVIDG